VTAGHQQHHAQGTDDHASSSGNRDGKERLLFDGLLQFWTQGVVEFVQLQVEAFLEWVDGVSDMTPLLMQDLLHLGDVQAGGFGSFGALLRRVVVRRAVLRWVLVSGRLGWSGDPRAGLIVALLVMAAVVVQMLVDGSHRFVS
jgi:hypothetical protein